MIFGIPRSLSAPEHIIPHPVKAMDAKDRKAFAYKYNLFRFIGSLRPTKEDEQGEVIEAYQIDSGTSTVIYNANGQPVEQNDAKGSFALHAYDALGRPTHVWAKDLSSEDVTLRQRMEYGESQSNPKTHNLLGKLYHQFNEAGVETVTNCDFKGNQFLKQTTNRQNDLCQGRDYLAFLLAVSCMIRWSVFTCLSCEKW